MAIQPDFIGKYKIQSVLAVGGMGTVYKATHPSLKREVIIKKLTLRNSGGTIRERFKREAQILLDLSSPYIVRMFDYFSEGRSDYIVLEFVDGMSLDKLIDKQVALPPQLALLITLDACYGLKSAHAKGIVHRDIKPGNILISKRAEIKLADFGIASGEKEEEMLAREAKMGLLGKSNSFDANKAITQVGVTLGTPAYMSPEQLDDSSSVDLKADIYSMGIMLYEMLTGSKPYPGDMAPETINKIKKGQYIPPEKLDKTIPLVARKIVKKMIRPNASKRYQSVEPIILKIRRYLKKFDLHEIRVSLAQSVVSQKSIVYPNYMVKKNIPLRILLSFIGAACILFALKYAWTEGFFHKTILSPWYTSVSLVMQMPSTASADADLPARAFFFVNDNDTIPEVKGTRRVFLPSDKNSSSGKNITYKTKTVHLKPGEYRLKISEGPYVLWKNLSVGKKDQVIELNFLKNAKRSLKINASSYDNETNKDLSFKTQFKILYEGKWVNLKSLPQESLRTGSVYKILAQCDGYEDELFSLRLDWYQDELFIKTGLRKK